MVPDYVSFDSERGTTVIPASEPKLAELSIVNKMSSAIKNQFSSAKRVEEDSGPIEDEETPFIDQNDLKGLYKILDVKHR